MRNNWNLFFALIFVMLAGVVLYLTIPEREQKEFTSIDITGSEWGKPVTFMTKDSQEFDLASYNGKFLAIFFGYLSCPDFCPNHLNKMTIIKNKLPEKIRRIFSVLFISVDPKRDDVGNLKQYVTSFDPEFIGVVPDNIELKNLIDNFKLVVNKTSVDNKNYLIDHYTYTYLFDPSSNLRLLIPFEISSDDVVRDIKILAKDL
jgi:protein SCO1/2